MMSKEKLQSAFTKAIEDEPDLELLELDENAFGYFDPNGGYERIYYYEDTPETIKSRILMDEEIKSIIDIDKLSQFLYNNLDDNSLCVMEHIAFIWDDENKETNLVRDVLYEEYGDEYAQEIGYGENMIGITWVERQIPVILIKQLLDSSIEISKDCFSDSPLTIFTEGLCSTIFHECRHLFYECNEIVPIGPGTSYPQSGGVEDKVEDYGNSQMEQTIHEFARCILPQCNDFINNYIEKQKDEMELA